MKLSPPRPLINSAPILCTEDGEIAFTFTHVCVQISYARHGAACLPAADFTPTTAGLLAEVSVWQNCAEAQEGLGVESFPFSPRGLPLGFASVEQVASILYWAANLSAPPPIAAYEKRNGPK